MATITILGTDCLEVTRGVSPNINRELLLRSLITGVVASTFQSKADFTEPDAWKYRYDTITELNFMLRDKSTLKVELQDVSNQPTWSDGTLSGLNQAASDILSWINGGSLSPVTFLNIVGGTSYEIANRRYHVFDTSDTIEITSLATNPLLNDIDVYVGAGGGGGGVAGGGAGGIKTFVYTATSLYSGVVTIGAGAPGQVPGGTPNQGNNSSIFGVSATGGGGGGTANGTGWNGNLRSGGQGGSGGGGAQRAGASGAPGIVGEGNAGGTCNWALFNPAGGGGKGGAAPNVNTGPNSGNGGAGASYSVTGSADFYGGGGGGGNDGTGLPGTGGVGGGGNGTINTGANGASNKSAGGGGGPTRGGSGGSGKVVISYIFE